MTIIARDRGIFSILETKEPTKNHFSPTAKTRRRRERSLFTPCESCWYHLAYLGQNFGFLKKGGPPKKCGRGADSWYIRAIIKQTKKKWRQFLACSSLFFGFFRKYLESSKIDLRLIRFSHERPYEFIYKREGEKYQV